jgi:hypothetical protein
VTWRRAKQTKPKSKTDKKTYQHIVSSHAAVVAAVLVYDESVIINVSITTTTTTTTTSAAVAVAAAATNATAAATATAAPGH